ncbi:zinc-binding dehydrogenase [Psychrobacillus sp. OK032]|uniref:zinc-binding dehydrogenase n=1 Tax=Psychrobacillus sp. OK032 TaxID=1884358 RepID=UPI0008C8986D|nr:zinc-binding dehydrogenase [Psychrobacillus sp. OK032]SER82605.1 D-arabinose 1-dehydrogenase, Zn-dependent alcohol dehydrogenase family [Psychrobacillus sp. OK032]
MENAKLSKVSVLEEFGKPIQFLEVPIPEMKARAILVRVEMAGICGSDVHLQLGELGVGNDSPLPIIQGHEIIGKIVELGEGRDTDINGEALQIGDRIMWEQISCGQCYWCQIANEPVLCSNRESYGFLHPLALRGGFAEHVYITPSTKVIKIPQELTNEETIGVACAFRCVVAGYERLGSIGFGENVVIQGSGPLGLYATVVARESNAGKVIVVGGPEDRLELAKKWGADHVINIDDVKDPADRKAQILELTNGRGPEVVIECSGYAPAFSEGIDIIQKSGRYLILGMTSSTATSLVPSLIVDKCITIIGSISATINHFHKGLQFIKRNRNKYPFAEIVTSKYHLEEINEALENMRLGKDIKPVIDNTGRPERI